VNRKFQLVEPKSERSPRTVVLPDIIVQVLRQHRANQLRERLIAGGSWTESGFVFTTPKGTPMDASNVNKRFKALLKAAGHRSFKRGRGARAWGFGLNSEAMATGSENPLAT
jgi:integrase